MHEILEPVFKRQDTKGNFYEIINRGQWETLLSGTKNKGAVMGNHFHKKTTVFFYITTGGAVIKTIHVKTGEEEQFHLKAHQGVVLPTDEAHAICFLEKSDFMMLKSRRYDPKDTDTFDFIVTEGH